MSYISGTGRGSYKELNMLATELIKLVLLSCQLHIGSGLETLPGLQRFTHHLESKQAMCVERRLKCLEKLSPLFHGGEKCFSE